MYIARQKEMRDELLAPNEHLGFDHDKMAIYLIGRQAYELAESELRKAVRLNPYEPAFKTHLAWCLYKQNKFPEAMEWIEKVLAHKPDYVEAQNIRSLLQQKIEK